MKKNILISKEFICTKCRRTLNFPSNNLGVKYCPACNNLMEVLQ